MAGRRAPLLVAGLLALLALVMAYTGHVMVSAQVADITAVYVEQVPLDPAADFWAQAEKVEIPLVAQNIVYPMTGETDTRIVRVAAAVDASGTLAFYLEWEDPTKDVPVPGGLDVYPDKVAMQFPVNQGAMPYICMGTQEEPVSIVLWTAPNKVETLVAGSAYGMKPEEREALGMHSVPTSPIERLPIQYQVWKGNAVYEDGKWKVVLYRPLAAHAPMVPDFTYGAQTSVAFALWEGSNKETGGMKTTSAWFTMEIGQPLQLAAPAEQPPAEAAQTTTVTTTVTATATTTVVTTTTVTQGGGLGNLVIGLFVGAAVATIAVAAYFWVVKAARKSG